MQRRLVLTTESARHPFRRSLAPFKIEPLPAPQPKQRWWKREDTHLFMLSFWAFFTCFYTFIA